MKSAGFLKTLALLFAILLNSCGTTDQKVKEIILSQNYHSEEFGIHLNMPDDWIVTENFNKANQSEVISIFPSNITPPKGQPLGLNSPADFTYIAIWPKGLGTELPPSNTKDFQQAGKDVPIFQFPVDRQRSKVLLLENNKPWAYFIAPDTPPKGWSESGFIFAQYGLNDFKATCFDKSTGKEKPLNQCDPLEGDRFVRKGQVKGTEANMVDSILASIELEPGQESSRSATELIKVEKPLPNMDITSPLTVKGEAVGYWYFEADFPIRLYDANDNLLTETFATAQGEWMTESFVPFEATLTFDSPDDERGRLVFERSNPSGLPENAQEYSIPVIFPPKGKQ